MVKNIIEQNEQVGSNDRVLETLREHFPGCFTSEGRFDMEVFSAMVKENVAVTGEGYGMNFLGKDYAQLLASLDTTTVIVPDTEHNSKPENAGSENVYISGDNLDALKHLLKSYTGKVKCIYIDPPYNTGSDGFVYNDNFNFKPEELQTRLGISEERAERILDLTTRGAASHSAWLTFMLPRLELAKDLLSPDGVIFISIDDNEQANLKILCDYVFGEENMIAQFCKKGFGGRQDSSHFAKVHEYVLCYANPQFVAGEELKEGDSYPCTDEQGKNYKLVLLRKWGDAATRADRPNMYYPLYYANGKISLDNPQELGQVEIYPMLEVNKDGRWRWGKDTMQEAITKHLIEVKEVSGELVPYEKVYEPDEDSEQTKLFTTWIDNIDNNTGKKLLKELFNGESPFEYPKPVDLIKRIVEMGNALDGIVLDFFSGSATTAHAVMAKNAEDHDHRKFIMVQWPEAVKEGSAADRLGYKTIDEIGQERIKRAAAKIKAETDAPIDYGFKHYTLAEPTDDILAKMERFDPMEAFGLNILEEFGTATVLQTWMMRDGYGFNAKIEEVKLDEYTAYLCGRHLYLINEEMSDDHIMALVKRYNEDLAFKPENIVLFGYSFNYTATEALKKNIATLSEGIKNLRVNIDIRY